MKKIYKNTLIFLIFFLAFLFKDYFYLLIGVFNVSSPTFNQEVIVLKAENKILREELNNTLELYNLNYFTGFEYTASKVLLRNPFTFYDTLIIENHNYEVGMAVVGDDGLIGRIIEVNKNTSRVDLVTKPNNDISVIVHGSYGILSGYSKEYNCLIIKNLNNYSNVSKGDYVYTSGLSKLPGGIIIGKVAKINYDHFKIEKNICVESKANLDNLHYVGVIKK